MKATQHGQNIIHMNLCRQLFIAVFMLCLAFTAKPQKIAQYFANKNYDRFAYARAIEKYTNILEKGDTSLQVVRNLADSYRLIKDTKHAEHWYGYLLEKKKDSLPEHILYYSEALKSNGKYKEAEYYLEKYAAFMPGDSRIDIGKTTDDLVEKLHAKKERFHVETVHFNTSFDEYGPVYFKKQLLFTASKNREVEPIKQIYSWTDEPYFDFFTGEITEPLDLDTVVPFSKELNTQYHEGLACFDDKWKTIFFSRNNSKKMSLVRDEKDISHIQLYKSTFNNGKWDEGELLPFNGKEFSCMHPTISDDGKTLFFASDMPGGKGKVDIYSVTKKDDGTWSAPKNLGDKINTEGDEAFPFVKQNLLYFSSNGYAGLGGLDVFVSTIKNGEYTEPVNVGAPVNSTQDDFSFIINEQLREGYFASNREGGKGGDDIYWYEIINRGPIPQIDSIALYQFDERVPVEPLGNDSDPDKDELILTLNDTKTKEGGKVELDKATNTVFYTPPKNFTGRDEVTYQVCDNWEPNPECKDTTIIFYVMKSDYSLICTVSNIETEKPVEGVTVTVTNLTTGKKESLITDIKGSIHMPLDATTDYKVDYNKETYFTRTSRTTTNGVEPGTIHLHEYLYEAVVGKTFKLENLYYDLDKSNIRPDASLVLDEVVRLMKENPTLRIELSSHTDCRASWSYNQRLSQRRAESARRYIVKNGIAKKRIIGKGYGETMLVNECKDGVECSEAKHQDNRRTEITILEF